MTNLSDENRTDLIADALVRIGESTCQCEGNETAPLEDNQLCSGCFALSILERVKKPFYITFGSGQGEGREHCYYVVDAVTLVEARQKAFDLFGKKWSMLYETAEEAGVEQYRLREIRTLEEGEIK